MLRETAAWVFENKKCQIISILRSGKTILPPAPQQKMTINVVKLGEDATANLVLS